MNLLYTLTIFLSAFLLFLTQPLYGRMILPYLGGAPAVWNTAMMFFQLVLLAGYAYAHFSLKWLGGRVQPWLHLGMIGVAFGCLPLGIPSGWTPDIRANPSLSVLWVLVRGVGVPFFVLAASAPLLQRWLSLTDPHQNPYVLYSASNLGSLLALFAFPLVLEPMLRLAEISALWRWLYVGLAGGLIACMAFLLRRGDAHPSRQHVGEADAAPIRNRERLRWLALAAVPSALLLAVTNHISMDVAAVSLLWVLPLALYLLSFVIVFSSWWDPGRWPELLTLLFGVLVVIVMLDIAWGLGPETHLKVLGLHLTFFFITVLLCHGQLAALKPEASRLTEFYLMMALGGALGGMSIALIAPVVFDAILEYPLAAGLAALFSAHMQRTFAHPLYRRFMWVVTVSMTLFVGMWQMFHPEWRGIVTHGGIIVLSVGLTLLVYVMVGRPRAFASALLVFGLVGFGLNPQTQVMARERSYFGAMSVRYEVRNGTPVRTLMHGTTVHGIQRRDAGKDLELTGYYHRQGAYGDLLHRIFAERQGPQRVAVVGLGAGTLGCYGAPEDTYVFYEIDPTVLHIAQNADWFTFLRDCPPRKQVVLGDARLTLAQAPDRTYDLIILDAFSSDAIPVHLMTLEALELYRRKLKVDGLMVYHISNRHLDLRPVVDALADRVEWVAYHSEFDVEALAEKYGLVLPTVLALVGREAAIPRTLKTCGHWVTRDPGQGRLLWTDDFANLWGAYRLQWR